MHLNIPRIAIGALRGGSGKTIASIAVICGWRKKGFSLTAFKKGPDFIDSAWLKEASGQPCYNLDTFLMAEKTVVQSFIQRTRGETGAVIEGNRGLYDGVDEKGSHSTASLAKLLKIPLILVIDCTKATRTIAALVLGCQKMDPQLKIKGIILNQIAGNRHASIIRSSIEQNCRIPILGEIPKLKDLPFPERHLGLVPPPEHHKRAEALKFCTEIGEKYLDLDCLWEVASKAPHLKISRYKEVACKKKSTSLVRIGVIKDSAFQFYYPENLEELERKGGEIVEINALQDKALPSVDGLYIGGGFPETNIEGLAANTNFRRSLQQAVEDGLPVYAECGGAMYLGKSVHVQNKFFPMVGIFPVVFNVDEKPWGHGYTILKSDAPNPFFKSGSVIRGHEFHYSKVEDWKEDQISLAFKVERGFGFNGKRDGLCYKNVLSTYTHIHALGEKRWASALVKKAELYKNN
jgi:cobyrinic acid a,c-diamide synthase